MKTTAVTDAFTANRNTNNIQSWERLILLKPETKAFYKSVVALTVPLALQNLINVGVSAADVVMLGLVGETALSGASQMCIRDSFPKRRCTAGV